jgi:hypothetical protein
MKTELSIPSRFDEHQIIRHLDLWIWAILLGLFNLPLLWSKPLTILIFSPASTVSNTAFSILLHPLIHVSLYHFALDAGAFLFLYSELRSTALHKRIICIAAGAVGSLVAALYAPSISVKGLCGLSGIGHGLMAVWALEMFKRNDPLEHRLGMACFFLVVIKSIYEAWSGQVFLDALHFGEVGSPIASCHAGGICGAITAYQLQSWYHSHIAERSLPGKNTAPLEFT